MITFHYKKKVFGLAGSIYDNFFGVDILAEAQLDTYGYVQSLLSVQTFCFTNIAKTCTESISRLTAVSLSLFSTK